MANSLSSLVPRRSFGFAGQEGALFDEMNQPQNSLSALMTNQSVQNAPQNYMRLPSGETVDLGQSRPLPPQFRGSPVDVFGQGKGFMQPDHNNISKDL